MVALGVAAWEAVEADGLRQKLRQAKTETASVQGDLLQVRQELSDLRAKGDVEPLLPGPAPAAAAEDGPAPDADGPRLVPLRASPEVLARAVQDLEKRVAAHQSRVDDLEKKQETAATQFARPMRFFRTVDQASSALDLSPGQKADLGRVVEDTTRDLDALYDTPNDDGRTFREVSKPKPLTTGKGDGDVGPAITLLMSNFAEIQKFKDSKVPGTSETYGQAEQRIRARGTNDARDLLTADQQKTWDRSHPDLLFGTPSMGNVFSISAINTTPQSDR